MNPTAMTLVLVVTLGVFAWSASRRWRLLSVTKPDPRITIDRASLVKRFWNVLVIAGLQRKMPANGRYRLEGVAHITIFAAFNVLLLNSVLLWGRGYDVGFDFWGLLVEDTLQGRIYSTAKELIAALCILGASVFVYDRTVRRLKRMSLGAEGLIILGIIITMMLADFLYVGARGALTHHGGSRITWLWWEPLGSALSSALAGLSPGEKKIEHEEQIGLQKIEQLTWKQALDLYTCTECGRCSDNCPAFTTGKKLSDSKRRRPNGRAAFPR